MTQRIVTIWAKTLVLAAFAVGFLCPVSLIAQSGESVRHSLDLTSGWRFQYGGATQDAVSPDFDDSGWQDISVPHSWNRLGEYQLVRSDLANTDQGIGWYRLSFVAPNRRKDQRQVLQFDGVGNVATLWVNGTRVGEHKGAFSRFRFDVTEQIRPGERNVIVVSADNSKPAPGSSTADVLPLGGDFFIHGGLYRNVSLLTVSDVQIDTLDHGGPGFYLRTTQVDTSEADIVVLARLRNLGKTARTYTLETRIFDADGNQVADRKAPVKLAKPAAIEVQQSLKLSNPRLWQGTADPYLYRAVVELRDGKRVVDRVDQPLGIRSFAFDADRGFLLNGKPVPLYGASRHQDVAGKGWALTAADHATDMALMTEMGLNAVRHAHYQHAQEWTDEADKAGMVVWAELPFVHESSLTNNAPTPALIENAKTQLLELIRQNYNHPSIMIWSVGNEIDIAASIMKMQGRNKEGKPAQSLGLLQTLNQLAKREDTGRYTAYADCCEGTPLQLAGAEVLSGVTDITAFNRYFGWYYGVPETLGKALDGFHAKYPSTPIILSEYGAGGAFSQHSDNPEGGPVNAYGRPHPEEYQSWVHEGSWQQIKARPYLSAAFLWNMFDFASTTREEGEAIDLNDKGLVSYDRKTRKDAFYFYKANLSAEPVVHILGRRYIDRAYPVTDVRVYSNAARASLTVNGISLGDVPCPDRICVWRNVALEAGSNSIAATADFAGQQHIDHVRWTAPDAEDGFHILAGTLTGGKTAAGQRFGSDNFFTGGTAYNLVPFGPGPKVSVSVANASDPALYRSYREGSFRYNLPLANGRWVATLHMFEPDAAKASARKFDVYANGKPVLTRFNPADAAGGALKATVRRFEVSVANGELVLDFRSGSEGAVVSAILVSKN